MTSPMSSRFLMSCSTWMRRAKATTSDKLLWRPQKKPHFELFLCDGFLLPGKARVLGKDHCCERALAGAGWAPKSRKKSPSGPVASLLFWGARTSNEQLGLSLNDINFCPVKLALARHCRGGPTPFGRSHRGSLGRTSSEGPAIFAECWTNLYSIDEHSHIIFTFEIIGMLRLHQPPPVGFKGSAHIPWW